MKLHWRVQQKLYALARQGFSRRRIARALGVTYKVVSKNWPKSLSWTREENALLKKLWYQVTERVVRKQFSYRTWPAIRRHAFKLHLESGTPQGCVPIYRAAEKYGVTYGVVLKVAEKYGVQIHRRYHGEKARQSSVPKFRYVEWDTIREALDKHFEAATVKVLAKELGTSPRRLTNALIAAGNVKPGHRFQWRITRKQAEQALELHAPRKVRRAA